MRRKTTYVNFHLLLIVLLSAPTCVLANGVTCRQTHTWKDAEWVEDTARILNYVETENSVLVGAENNKQIYNFYSEDKDAKYFLNSTNQAVYRIQKPDLTSLQNTWELFTAPFDAATKNIWFRAFRCSKS